MALCLGASLVAAPAGAGTQSRLQKIQDQQKKQAEKAASLGKKREVLSTKVAQLDRLREQVESQVNELDGRLGSLQAELTGVKENLTKAQKKLSILSEELYKVLKKLDERTETFKARAVAAYMAGPTAYFDSMLTSESLSDLVDRQVYYESALDSDSQLLQDIETMRADTEARRELIIEEQERIIKAKNELEDKKILIARLREERAGALAEREQVLSSKQVVLSQVKDREGRAQAMLSQLQRDENAIRAVLAARMSSSVGTSTGSGGPAPSGQFEWPAGGPLTSSYGYRTHPIFGDTRMHTGIDIGAPYGSGVFAAESGTVAFVGAMSGYGNVIVVDHGGGLATTYNHLSSFGVSRGQTVGRGATIGGIGCSGYCTGPHLHFEVRINGSPIDPMPYFQ
jgi:murein DD-endopeptidase MepM/ murein hydrolase activator NlpD